MLWPGTWQQNIRITKNYFLKLHFLSEKTRLLEETTTQLFYFEVVVCSCCWGFRAYNSTVIFNGFISLEKRCLVFGIIMKKTIAPLALHLLLIVLKIFIDCLFRFLLNTVWCSHHPCSLNQFSLQTMWSLVGWITPLLLWFNFPSCWHHLKVWTTCSLPRNQQETGWCLKMIELRGINYGVENLGAEKGKDVSQSC